MGEEGCPRQWGFYFAFFAILAKVAHHYFLSHSFVDKLC
jgi:hypothetical protein